jgi:hypothetical protein
MIITAAGNRRGTEFGLSPSHLRRRLPKGRRLRLFRGRAGGGSEAREMKNEK